MVTGAAKLFDIYKKYTCCYLGGNWKKLLFIVVLKNYTTV